MAAAVLLGRSCFEMGAGRGFVLPILQAGVDAVALPDAPVASPRFDVVLPVVDAVLTHVVFCHRNTSYAVCSVGGV